MHKNAIEKYNSIKYDLNRLKSVYIDTGGHVNSIDAQQAFLQFCTDTYSLHDWLIRESKIDKKIWEEFLSNTLFLFLVAKIETINKHAAADKDFWNTRCLDIQTNHHAVLIPPSKNLARWITQGKYVVTVDGIELDSLALAEGALDELGKFLKSHNIPSE